MKIPHDKEQILKKLFVVMYREQYEYIPDLLCKAECSSQEIDAWLLNLHFTQLILFLSDPVIVGILLSFGWTGHILHSFGPRELYRMFSIRWVQQGSIEVDAMMRNRNISVIKENFHLSVKLKHPTKVKEILDKYEREVSLGLKSNIILVQKILDEYFLGVITDEILMMLWPADVEQRWK